MKQRKYFYFLLLLGKIYLFLWFSYCIFLLLFPYCYDSWNSINKKGKILRIFLKPCGPPIPFYVKGNKNFYRESASKQIVEIGVRRCYKWGNLSMDSNIPGDGGKIKRYLYGFIGEHITHLCFPKTTARYANKIADSDVHVYIHK